MAKAPEKYKAKETSSAPETDESAAPVSEVAPAPAAPAPAAPEEQQLELKDAARRFIPGFKDHWWPAIAAHAKTMGFLGTGTAEQCKAVLRHWGAKI